MKRASNVETAPDWKQGEDWTSYTAVQALPRFHPPLRKVRVRRVSLASKNTARVNNTIQNGQRMHIAIKARHCKPISAIPSSNFVSNYPTSSDKTTTSI